MTSFVEEVKRHALANYDSKSWSYVVEAWTDTEIAREIAGCANSLQAIRKMQVWVDMHFSFAEDIRNS
jgi:hypothetical protein